MAFRSSRHMMLYRIVLSKGTTSKKLVGVYYHEKEIFSVDIAWKSIKKHLPEYVDLISKDYTIRLEGRSWIKSLSVKHRKKEECIVCVNSYVNDNDASCFEFSLGFNKNQTIFTQSFVNDMLNASILKKIHTCIKLSYKDR